MHELLSLFDKSSICDVILSTNRKSQPNRMKGWQTFTISYGLSNTKNASGSPWMSFKHMLSYFIQHINVNGYDIIGLNVPIPLKVEATG